MSLSIDLYSNFQLNKISKPLRVKLLKNFNEKTISRVNKFLNPKSKIYQQQTLK